MIEDIVGQNESNETSGDNNQNSEYKKEESSEDYYVAFKLTITDESYI